MIFGPLTHEPGAHAGPHLAQGDAMTWTPSDGCLETAFLKPASGLRISLIQIALPRPIYCTVCSKMTTCRAVAELFGGGGGRGSEKVGKKVLRMRLAWCGKCCHIPGESFYAI